MAKKTQKTNKDDKYLKWNKDYTFASWSAQKDFNPALITKAKGVYLWDHKGNKHLDFSSQLVLTNIGHSDKRVLDAMTKQMQDLQYVFPGHASKVRGEVGKKLAEITPGGITKTFFTLGGADANENAIKMARMYTGRDKIVTRYRAYHGGTFIAASAGGDPRRIKNNFDASFFVRVHDAYSLRSPLYKGKSKEKGDLLLLETIKETITLEGAETVAAILMEGYSGSSGVLQPTSKAFWKDLRKFCDEHGILLIADEVMSGFGRTGKWFGCSHWGVNPDMITMAKGLTSGYAPLGAVSVTKKIAKYFDKNFLNCGLTYSAHCVSLAAASEVLDIYKKDKIVEKAAKSGKYLKTELTKLQKKHPSLGEFRGDGMHYCLELVKDKKMTPLSPWNKPLSKAMQDVLKTIKTNRIQVLSRWNWIFVTPPLIASKKEIDEGIAILDKALSVADKYYKK